MENSPEMINKPTTVPEWYGRYTERIQSVGVDLLDEVKKISEMDYKSLTTHLGGDPKELPYEFLQTLFIDGSDDPGVAEMLRDKRGRYLKEHPEEMVARGAGEGIITYDGRFIPKSIWDTATDSEKRGALVGSTCFHYNSETPGMGSSPKDRF